MKGKEHLIVPGFVFAVSLLNAIAYLSWGFDNLNDATLTPEVAASNANTKFFISGYSAIVAGLLGTGLYFRLKGKV